MTTKLRFTLAALLAIGLLLSACGGGAAGPGDSESAAPADEESAAPQESAPPEEAEEAAAPTITEGVLTVCTDSPYPPMEFEKNGEFTGFDIELMRAVADEMGGLTVEVNNTGFDPITSGTALESDQCDIAAASITITPEREEFIAFTEPYFDAEQSLLVKKDSGIAALEDLAGKRIAVQSGTTGKKYAEKNAPESEVVAFDNPGDIFLAIEAGDVEAVVQDLVVNGPRAVKDPSVEVVETYSTDEQYGFALALDNTELLDAVNEALAALQDNGTYDDLFKEWFGG